MQKHTNKSPVNNVLIIKNYINSQRQTKNLLNIFITHLRLQKNNENNKEKELTNF